MTKLLELAGHYKLATGIIEHIGYELQYLWKTIKDAATFQT